MDYIIPVGRFSGRPLGSLSPDERQQLRRTRVPQLAQARERLGAADQPAPVVVEQPEVILPLVLARRQGLPLTRWPPQPAPRWASSFKLPRPVRILAILAILMLMHPPSARLPGMLIGVVVRGLALRCREVATQFLGSITDQLGDLTGDLFEWLDSWFSFLPVEPGKPAPGQKFVTFLFGLVALRSIRMWG